jgi:two-component system, OmpR family, phosphate regulon sensor histidine kinase PhoR
VLALIAGATMVPDLGPLVDRAGSLTMAAGFGLVPLLMLRFARVFGAVPSWVWHGAVAGTPVLVGGALLFVLDVLSPALSRTWLVVFVALWFIGHLLAANALRRGGRGRALAVARRRAQLMAVAVLGLGSIMPLAGMSGVLTQDGSATGILLFSALVVGLLLFGFAPPAAVRWHWSRHEREELGHAQRRLIESDDPERLATDLLPHIARLAGGSAAWWIADDEILGAHPVGTPVPPAALRGTDAAPAAIPHTSVRVTVVTADRRERLLVADTGRGRLVIVVDPYALLFGARDLEAVAVLATQLAVAVDRARLRARELTTVREREAARRIAEVERVRDDVLATVSHEMRTPLTTVCGVTSLLLDRWEHLDDTRRQQLLSRVAANAEDLRSVVEDLLDLTAQRLATSGSGTEEETEIAALVTEVTDRLRVALEGHRLTTDVPDGTTVMVDRAVVAQMLRHLLLNAAKFSDPGTAIRVTGTVEDGALALTITDEGVGMEAAELERAFDPFFRAGDVLRRETRGLGLGLTLVAALAEVVGADIRTHSEPGVGTDVTLRLPRVVRVGAVDGADRHVPA